MNKIIATLLIVFSLAFTACEKEEDTLPVKSYNDCYIEYLSKVKQNQYLLDAKVIKLDAYLSLDSLYKTQLYECQKNNL